MKWEDITDNPAWLKKTLLVAGICGIIWFFTAWLIPATVFFRIVGLGIGIIIMNWGFKIDKYAERHNNNSLGCLGLLLVPLGFIIFILILGIGMVVLVDLTPFHLVIKYE